MDCSNVLQAAFCIYESTPTHSRHVSAWADEDAPNQDFREVLGVPSLQCLIIWRRLELLSAVLRSEVRALSILLRSTSPNADSAKLPWVNLVISDLYALRSCMGEKLADLGDPVGDASKWFSSIRDHPAAWKAMLNQLSVPSMPIDHYRAKTNAYQVDRGQAFKCEQCEKDGKDASFPSVKTLLCHMRKLHGERNVVRTFVDGNAICPVCRVGFETRMRAVAHLTEARCRGLANHTCRRAVEAGRFEPLPTQEVAALDAADAVRRKRARAVGKTQVTVRIPAKRARVCGSARGESITNAPNLPYRPSKRLRSKTAEADTMYVVKRLRVNAPSGIQ